MSIELKLRATAVTLIDADFPPAETVMVPVPGADAVMWIWIDPNPFCMNSKPAVIGPVAEIVAGIESNARPICAFAVVIDTLAVATPGAVMRIGGLKMEMDVTAQRSSSFGPAIPQPSVRHQDSASSA
jgi:hypothetical protein